MLNPDNKILAIIVTYNRLELLKRCYDALTKQTINNFDILIINNGSNDGTYDWLNSIDNDCLTIINQENCGGAGGFYAGMKYGEDNNYKYLWMMDDDGLPESHQLEVLFNYAETNHAILLNAIVCDIDHPNLLAFSQSRTVDSLDEVIVGEVFHPFNGTFIHRDLIKAIGYIKREMFIWGDEVEYSLRVRKSGVVPIVLKRAIHYHPHIHALRVKVLPPLIRRSIVLKPVKFSRFYYRNLGYIDSKYSNWHVVLANNISHVVYFIRKCRFNELWKFLNNYWHGYFDKFD